VAEHQLPKLSVEGSIPFARSNDFKGLAKKLPKFRVAAVPSGTAEPMIEAMRFLLEAARRGRIGIRAFRGANPEHEPIPTWVLSDLEINFLARASRADDAGGEGDLVPLDWGAPDSGIFPTGDYQVVARNVRFSRDEIEGITRDFVASLEGRSAWSETAAPKKSERSRRQRERALQAAKEIWSPDGVPPERLSDEKVYQKVCAHQEKSKVGAEAKALPGKDTVLRAVGRRKDKPK
jgi:hypothetical protein